MKPTISIEEFLCKPSNRFVADAEMDANIIGLHRVCFLSELELAKAIVRDVMLATALERHWGQPCYFGIKQLTQFVLPEHVSYVLDMLQHDFVKQYVTIRDDASLIVKGEYDDFASLHNKVYNCLERFEKRDKTEDTYHGSMRIMNMGSFVEHLQKMFEGSHDEEIEAGVMNFVDKVPQINAPYPTTRQ